MNGSSAVTLKELLHRFNFDDSDMKGVIDRYPCRISSYYAGLISSPLDPIWLQCVPSPAELEDNHQQADPLAEERLSPAPGLIHRYPDRAVLLVSNRCAVYCRFCMRKRQVGQNSCNLNLDAALEYIAANSGIRDILLSGGDPLMLPLDQLNGLLTAVRKIRSVEIIRVGSRIPVTDPQRIDQELCRMLASHHPLYLNTHFNHPQELTELAAKGCQMLADAGIQLGNQTVLLKGVNNDLNTLQRLFSGLLRLRVRPYYLHQMDLVQGTAHFRTPLETGRELISHLRGNISGMAIPHYVVDLPGGRGKVPVQPDTLRKTGNSWEIRCNNGEWIRYNDP